MISCIARLKMRQKGVVTLLGCRNLAAVPQRLEMVKELRESSGAPISDVKAALDEAEYDVANAFQILRKKGLAAANKKATRHASEGLIGLAKCATAAALVEINSETDFVARNKKFTDFVSLAAQAALKSDSGVSTANHEIGVDELSRAEIDGKSLGERVQDLAGTLRENISLRRAYRLQVTNGILSSYLHISRAPGLGRIGSIVALEAGDQSISSSSMDACEEVGSKLAMHAAAANPRFLDQYSVPDSALEAEKEILRAQAAKSGKPANIIEKMINGRLKKYYEENCLMEQELVMDDSQRVKDLLSEAANKTGIKLRVSGFVRVQCGEGLDSDSTKKDFASEVAETLHRTA